MESTSAILLDAEDKMTKTMKVLHDQFDGLRTGKASPALVENLRVPYYGTPTKLREIAGISTPEPRLIVINAYDPTALPEIEKTILAANLGVTPMNDGRVIRVPIPELSEERRKELIKVAKRMAEEGRVSVRNVRRDANEHVKKLEKDHKVSEDQKNETLKKIQKDTDDYIKKIDDILKAKETVIMAV